MKTLPSSANHPPHRRTLRYVVGVCLLVIALVIARWPDKNPITPPPETNPVAATTAVPSPPPAVTPERIRTAVGPVADPVADPRGLTRTAALRALADDLTLEETAALLAALLAPRQPGESAGPHSVWFHETALVLQNQASIREEFATTLGTVARDVSRDPVIRDYALQHLSLLWQNSDATLAAAIQSTLAEIADQFPEVTPSALLALHRLTSTAPDSPLPAVPDAELAPRLRDLLAADATASTAAQMTAVRIVGERRLTGFREDLSRLAADPSTGHTLVRMAAIAAIARLADPGDLPLLRTLDRSDPRVATAIDHAIARLESTQ